MSKKDGQSGKKTSGKKSGFTLELTRKQFFLWLGIIFFGMAWMFTLGIFVGRGLSPVHFDIQDIKKELMALKEAALKRDKAALKESSGDLSNKPDLDFYKVLTDKKKEALLKSAKGPEKTAKPYTKPQQAYKKGEVAGQALLTVQVASLKNAKDAKQMVTRLKRKGYDAFTVTTNIRGKGTYHRVRVGHFTNSNKAGRMAARLKQNKFETIIVRE